MKNFIHVMIVAICLACAAVRHHNNSKLHLPGVITTTEFSEPTLLPGHGDVRVRNELNRLYRLYKQYGCLKLYCWCAPKRCHAETIRDVLMEALERC